MLRVVVGARSNAIALLLSASACAANGTPPRSPEPAPVFVPESRSPHPSAAVSSGRDMIRGETVFFHHGEGARVRVPPDSAVVTVVDHIDDERSGTFKVHAIGEGTTTFDVESASGIATHRVDVVHPAPGSVEEALVDFAASRESVRLFRRARESANAPTVWLVDGCFDENGIQIVIRLQREYLGRVETIAARVPPWASGRCEK